MLIHTMAHRWNSREAFAARCARGARNGHATMRAQGRVPGEDATRARMAYARQRRLIRSLDAAPVYDTGALLDSHASDPLNPRITDSGASEL